MRNRRGFTLLEMIVATTILGIALVGLLSGLSGATRNAIRLREYDRVVQLARLRMNDLLADVKAPKNTQLAGLFDSQVTGGIETGWRAMVTTTELTPALNYNGFALDHVELEVWWMVRDQRRSFHLEGYRRRPRTPEDVDEVKPK